MNTRAAITETLDGLRQDKWEIMSPVDMAENHIRHLFEMEMKINADQTMSEGKLNRWLGWMQGVICVCTNATLDEMKEINKRHA